MKDKRTIYALALALFFGTTALGTLVAQEEKPREEAPPAQQEPEAKPEKQETPKTEKQENPKPENQDKNASKEEKKQEKQEKKQEKANSQSQPESRPAPAGSTGVQGGGAQGGRPAGKGGHIPDDKFRSNFGKSHTFVINRPVVVNNQTTFQYGGYSFILVDPWPVGWAYTDDCYIDYIDGDYFLFDLLHPGVRIALFVEI